MNFWVNVFRRLQANMMNYFNFVIFFLKLSSAFASFFLCDWVKTFFFWKWVILREKKLILGSFFTSLNEQSFLEALSFIIFRFLSISLILSGNIHQSLIQKNFFRQKKNIRPRTRNLSFWKGKVLNQDKFLWKLFKHTVSREIFVCFFRLQNLTQFKDSVKNKKFIPHNSFQEYNKIKRGD